MSESFLDEKAILFPGDCLDVLPGFDPNSFDACVTDPPYGLGFMGKSWDHGVPGVPYWKLVFRALKPGAFCLAFGGDRMVHRLAVAIEDAGFEIRGQCAWIFGSGFPKSLDCAKAIDKHLGVKGTFGDPKTAEHVRFTKGDTNADRVHEGWKRPWMDDPEAVNNSGRQYIPASEQAKAFSGFGTALKPAMELICLARKPLEGTVAQNVLKWGTGALNIDGCRVATDEALNGGRYSDNKIGDDGNAYGSGINLRSKTDYAQPPGRWPANIIHDGSEEVVGAFPESESTAARKLIAEPNYKNQVYGRGMGGTVSPDNQYSDSGSAARFFYTAKADSDDRLGSKHPTVKPLDLMQYLVRLVTPPGGLVLDPFAGTGTTGEACFREGMRAVLIEREEEYQNDIRRRMALVMAGPGERRRESVKTKPEKPFEAGSLFAAR